MVWMIVIIGYTFRIPDTVMGLTFIAAGVSVPDALSGIAVVREGKMLHLSTVTTFSTLRSLVFIRLPLNKFIPEITLNIHQYLCDIHKWKSIK